MDTTKSALRIRVGEAVLDGDLTLPPVARALVIFAHGSGSSRRSPRNQSVAATLNTHRFATFLFDLLTTEEEAVDRETGRLRFDIPLLAQRLVGASDILRQDTALVRLPLGFFGASTGAAAALIAAAERPTLVGAVVSRGGRPDLVGDALARVRAATLLIIGGNDLTVL